MPRRLIFALVAALAFPGVSQAASFVFGAPTTFGTSLLSNGSVAIADINGDGRDDLATVGELTDSDYLWKGYLTVLLQHPDGTLGSGIRLQTKDWVNRVAAARLRPDGPVVFLVGHNSGLAVYRWDGSGTLVPTEYGSAPGCGNVEAADLDADGHTDVVCVGEDAIASIYYGSASGSFEAPRYMATAAMTRVRYEILDQFRLKDATGDGRPDLLIASSNVNSFYVYANDGQRGFLPAVAYTYPEFAYLWSGGIEALDADHDGANEVFSLAPCGRQCATLFRYRQGTDGYLELAESTPIFTSPDRLLATDVDRDGLEDLLVVHRGWFTISRHMGRPQGLSTAALWTSVQVNSPYPEMLATGDLNGDGHVDLAVGPRVLYGGLQAVSDFNSDLRADLVWRLHSGEVIAWLSADSQTTRRFYLLEEPDWSIQAIADFDGDNTADIFRRNQTTGANEIQSAGSTVLEGTSPVSSQAWQVVGAGDFDGDGRADLLWRNSSTGANSIWPSGNTALSHAIATVNDLGWKVATVGDFDGDRRSDILWRHSGTGRNAIWRSGRHDLSQAVSTVSNTQWAVVGAGDFNGDGRDDVVWRNSGTGANAIWLSANSATTLSVTPVTNLAWTIAAIGDYDGDRRADLMWRNTSTGANVIWRSGDSRQQQAVTSIQNAAIVR